MGEIYENKDEVAIALSSNEVEARYEAGRCRKKEQGKVIFFFCFKLSHPSLLVLPPRV